MAKQLTITLGALSKSILEQLQEHGIQIDPVEGMSFQKDSDAITRLSVRRLITDNQKALAQGKLFKRIHEAARNSMEKTND